MPSPARRLTTVAFLIAVGAVLHWLEGLLPPPLPVAGAKLGLANIVTLVSLLGLGPGPALSVAGGRVLVGSLVGGGFAGLGFLMSAAGAFAAVPSMYIASRSRLLRLSTIGTSVVGAVAHNLAQLAVFYAATGSRAVLFYVPYLVGFALPAGALVGLTARYVLSILTTGSLSILRRSQ